MKFLFDPDGPIFRFTEKFANLMILNFLFLVCCIPIVTIGPATTAMYYVSLKMARNEESGIFKAFFHSFRQNLKQGIVVGLIVMAVGIFLAFDAYYIYQIVAGGTLFHKVIFVLVGSACIFYLMTVTYVYPMLAKFENSTKQLFRSAAILSIRHLLATAVMLFISAVPIATCFFSPVAMMGVMLFYIVFGHAGIAFLQSKFLTRIFWQYIPKDENDDGSIEE